MKQRIDKAVSKQDAFLIDRSVYVDLLRIVATFGVVILHTSAQNWYDTPVNTLDWQIMNFYDCLVRWAVPIFVMISGIFHLRSNKNCASFKDELLVTYKKIFRIICAIIFWSIVYSIYTMFTENRQIALFSIVKVIGATIFGPAYYHLWFLYMLIGLYLLTPMLRVFVNNCKKEYIEYVLVLSFTIGACFPLINTVLNNISAFNDKAIYLPIAELTGYMGYYIAGYYFASYEIKKKTKVIFYILGLLSLLFTIAGTSVVSLHRNEPFHGLYEYLLPNTMLQAYAVFLLFKDLFGKISIQGKSLRIMAKISKDTFGIYLVHALMLQVLCSAQINTLTISPAVSIPIIAIMVILLSEISTMVINKIPLLNKYVI